MCGEKRRYRIIGMMSLILIVCMINFKVKADAMEGKITLSPDGKAFTTNAGDRNTRWYEQGYEVKTGVDGASGVVGIGEHEFAWERRGVVPVKSWKVAWKTGRCIHDSYPAGNQYHGVSFGKKSCSQNYYSGWLAYCADCGELMVSCLFYMSDDVAKSLKSIDVAKAYYYKCPHCNNLEQGAENMVHYCKGVSANRYFVHYNANFGSGSMEKSTHIVSNATEYEGQSVIPQTRLNLNTYYREGYEFVGWNTKKDGSGKSYVDGATIYNLCIEDNDSIVLYAQWKKRTSILEIDPNGGSYEGKEGIQRITGHYKSEYQLSQEVLTAPKGVVVHFNTMGGEVIADMTTENVFKGWDICQPFHGKLKDCTYSFLGEEGTIDRIVALYEQWGIILPEAKRDGHSFGGWYADEEGLIPIGQTGDRYSPGGEVTLYAKWVELKLVSKDNNTANQGKGAVDLSWSQKDSQNKVYEVFQKREEELWEKVHDEEEESKAFQVLKTIFYSGNAGEYTVPHTGFYTLYLAGAQGGKQGEFPGGKGGSVEAVVYLKKGEKLEYFIGGQDGTNVGDSRVSLQNKGELLVVGGGSGNAVFHEHSKACEHAHIGTPHEYGGCYTKTVCCGSTEIEYQVTHTSFGYKNIGSDGNPICCPECNSYECKGHLTEYGNYVCKQCGNEEKYPISVCTAKRSYALACGDTAYICGFKEGQVMSYMPIDGGVDFVNKELCIDYKETRGVQEGNGVLTITSEHLEVREELQLLGVEATDMAAPEQVNISTIVKSAVSDHEIRVAWKRPKDNGTDYYHQVKSYEKGNMQQISKSNITKNTLVSQVVGYRYWVNNSPSSFIDGESLFLEEKGENAFLVLQIEEEPKYLHLAAQDKAGNIGPVIHINISSQEMIYWPLITEKLLLTEERNIAPASAPDTYFVKADGNTPIQLTLEGMLCGQARKDYQIDIADFIIQNMRNSMSKGVLSVLIPKKDKIGVGSYTYPSESIMKKQTGNSGVGDASYIWVQRFNTCKSLVIKQKLTISSELDGMLLRITPRVAAQGKKETIYSKEEQDLLNSIYLIADARSPYINGVQQLEQFTNGEQVKNEKLVVRLEAGDTGSGLAQFYVEVYNHDSTLSRHIEDLDLTGQIELQMDPQEPIYHGDFTVLVYAKDRVGNETSVHSGLLNVGVDAGVYRILDPQTTIFKRGESGILHINAWGYVDRVEVYFPEEFTTQDATLNRILTYELPGYVKKEEISFVVPLSIPDGNYTIQVRAYKDGVEYQADPGLVTITIQGDVRDELRTRLK